jgi:hypothetical protein
VQDGVDFADRVEADVGVGGVVSIRGLVVGGDVVRSCAALRG